LKLTTLLALLMTCGIAQAAEWASLGTADNGRQRIFIDVSSIREVGAIRRAWFKAIVAPHTMKESSCPDANKWWTYVVERVAINCSDETFRTECHLLRRRNKSEPR
jgi:hypothetical protein